MRRAVQHEPLLLISSLDLSTVGSGRLEVHSLEKDKVRRVLWSRLQEYYPEWKDNMGVKMMHTEDGSPLRDEMIIKESHPCQRMPKARLDRLKTLEGVWRLSG